MKKLDAFAFGEEIVPEEDLLKKLSEHANIVKYYDSFKLENKYLCLMLEYCNVSIHFNF